MGKTKSKKVVKTKPKAKPKGKANAPAPCTFADGLETPVGHWQFLVRRLHPWCKQLYVKGRNLTARQLVGWMMANHFDEEGTAQNYHLPIEAVREALAYVAQTRELLEIETEIERLMGKRGGAVRAAQPVP